MIPKRARMADKPTVRIESESNVQAYLQDMRYALDNRATVRFQRDRLVDIERDKRFTNKFTVSDLFPDEDPVMALKRELRLLTVKNYLRTEEDIRNPQRKPFWVFGKEYEEKGEVYIKIRCELLDMTTSNGHIVFIMSFHYAEKPFYEENFPYKK